MTIDPLLLEQFDRCLRAADAADPWGELLAAGFLDLCRPESEGGAGVGIDGLFGLAVAAARLRAALPVVQTIVARRHEPDALAVADIERFLVDRGCADVARPLAALLAAGSMVGLMEALLDMTVDYARVREQFGGPIARFQAVQHQIAVMAEHVFAARIATEAAFAGWRHPPRDALVAIAKSRATRAARVVTATAHAVHGAIGISGEHALGGLAARLRALGMAHGGAAYWDERLGAAVLDDDAPAIEIVVGLQRST